MFPKNKFAAALVMLTVLSCRVAAQTDDPEKFNSNTICFTWHCSDPYQKFGFTESIYRGLGLYGTKAYRTHLDSTIMDGLHRSKRDQGVLKASLNFIAFKRPYDDRSDGRLTFDGIEICPTCTSDSSYSKSQHVAEMARLKVMGATPISLDISARLDSGVVGVVVENKMGLLRGDGVYFVDESKQGASIGYTCIDMHDEIQKENDYPTVSPGTAIKRLEAYRRIADLAYNGTLGQNFEVRGNLGHSSSRSHISSTNDAAFERKSSLEPSPYFLHMIGFGDTKTHDHYTYPFEIVDVCEQPSPTISSFASSTLDLLYGATQPAVVEHPAGVAPNGFRAITCKCKCCPKEPKYIVAYAGTFPVADIGDWWSNLSQGIPIFNPEHQVENWGDVELRTARQYIFALQYMRWVHLKYGGAVAVCGHSLGGGMASYISAYFEIEGYCYNAAPLSSAAHVLKRLRKRPDLYCTHVQAGLDFVSVIGEYVPFQNAYGQIFQIEGTNRPLSDHSLSNMTGRIIGYRPPEKFK